MRQKILWYAAVVLDILHLPLAIGVLILGRLWLPLGLYLTVVATVVFLQISLLGCPLTVLTYWMKRQYKPETISYTGSMVAWLYRRYGRIIAIPILINTMLLATVVDWIAYFKH